MDFFTFEGNKISKMCLGTMMFGNRCDESESKKIVDYSLNNGVNFFDVAESYNKGLSEEILGKALASKRKQSIIVSKGHISDKESFTEKVEKSLKRLGTDYLDFYLIHWPKNNMNVEKIMRELDKIVQSGKVRFLGCSNYPLWLFSYSNEVAIAKSLQTFKLWQFPYNLIERGAELEILPYAYIHNTIVITYRPLVMGLLSGKYVSDLPIPQDSRGADDDRLAELLSKYGKGLSKFLDFAKQKNIHPVHLALAWVRYNKAVTAPIAGVSSLKQLESTIKSFNFSLSEEEYQTVTSFFDTEVKEESLGKFKSLRRSLDLLGE